MGKVSYTINTSLVKDKTVGDVFQLVNRIERAGGAERIGVDRDLGIAAQWVRNELIKYRFNEKGFRHTVADFYRMHKMVAEDFIHNHRLNYMTFYTVRDVCDWLDDKGKLVFTAKSFWKKIDRIFSDYQQKHKSMVDHCVWMTINDHMGFAYNTIAEHIEPLENAIRDYLIQHRSEIIACKQKDDITLLAKTYLCLLFCAALRNTKRNFFNNILEQKGFDLSVDYTYADIEGVSRNFVFLMQTLGIKFCKDDDGDDVPIGVDIAKSVRVESEWNNIVRKLTDADLMDEMAIKAINLNPETKADYENILAKQEKVELDKAIEDLKTMPNVKVL